MQELGVVIVAVDSFAKKCYSGSQKPLSWLGWARTRTQYRRVGVHLYVRKGCQHPYRVIVGPLASCGHWMESQVPKVNVHVEETPASFSGKTLHSF